jgi:3',5'-cyclic AMP phosphodiesterase CpdA
MAIPPQLALGRRAFLQGSTLTLLAAGLAPTRGLAGEASSPLRFGLLTDLHYADKPAAGSRHYRETPAKLDEAIERIAREKPHFTVELGDFIDAAEDVPIEKEWLRTIHEQFNAIPGPKHYVLGNHCVDTLRKEEFLDAVGQSESAYSFDAGGMHFVILDSCFRHDGVAYGRKNSNWDDANIPPDQIDWLRADLTEAQKPTIVFAHQRLDGSNRHCVKNAADVRRVFEQSGQVLAVFQGHSHQNDYKHLGGIHYATLVAMVEGHGEENSGYALADIAHDGTIHIRGFRRQSNYDWQP